MFDSRIAKSEQDCIVKQRKPQCSNLHSMMQQRVKLWGPVLEKLVQQTPLRLKWGESSCSLMSNSLRADFRVIANGANNMEYDIMQIKATKKISHSLQKFDFDHYKLLIETKDSMDYPGTQVGKGPRCIQFRSLQLLKYHFKPAADTLYVANQLTLHSILPTVKSFTFIQDLCNTLLATKNEWIDLQRTLVLANSSPISAERSSQGPPNQQAHFKKCPSWYPS
ncbi:hypothetical protein MBANPS3_010819 [Mucor bainieri]